MGGVILSRLPLNISSETYNRNKGKTKVQAIEKYKNSVQIFGRKDEKIVFIILPRLEYARVIWSLHKKKDLKETERLQRTVTKVTANKKDFP